LKIPGTVTKHKSIDAVRGEYHVYNIISIIPQFIGACRNATTYIFTLKVGSPIRLLRNLKTIECCTTGPELSEETNVKCDERNNNEMQI